MKWIVLAVLTWISTLLYADAAPNETRQSTNAAVTACKAISKLLKPSFSRTQAHFLDSEEIFAILVRGIKPPPSMKDQSGAELCLYYSYTKRARLADWDEMVTSKKWPRPIKAPTDL